MPLRSSVASISICGSELDGVLFNAICEVLQRISVNEAGQRDGLLNTLFFSPLFFSKSSFVRCKKNACMMIYAFCMQGSGEDLLIFTIDGFYKIFQP